MSNRRNYRKPTKPKTTTHCEPCADLKYTPEFLNTIIRVNNFVHSTYGVDWYHKQGHTIFK